MCLFTIVRQGCLFCLQNWLAYIMVGGDNDEMFLSYGYDEDNSNILDLTFKQILPNIFQDTSFKKYDPMLLNERSVQEYSTLFFYLPSTTDRKEKINQFVKNISLHQSIASIWILRNTLEIRQILDHRTLTHQIWKGN